MLSSHRTILRLKILTLGRFHLLELSESSFLGLRAIFESVSESSTVRAPTQTCPRLHCLVIILSIRLQASEVSIYNSD